MERLYIYRKLLNVDDVINWTAQNGFKSILNPEHLHITQLISSVTPNDIALSPHDVKIRGGAKRAQYLGPDAIVITFFGRFFDNRMRELIAFGCNNMGLPYIPHVTISNDVIANADVNLDELDNFRYPLIFSPEIAEPYDPTKQFTFSEVDPNALLSATSN